MIKTWIETHRETGAEEERQRAERAKLLEAERTGTFERRHMKMEDRIRRVLAAMPEAERNRERHITWFRDAMRSKYPARGAGRASVAEIGPALTALGWRRVRRWLGAERTYRAVWVPPLE
jgi:hypothetical protein